MIAKQLNDNQRVCTVTYDSMDELLNRKDYIQNTLQNYLKRTQSNEYIEGTYISMTPTKYLFNIVLTED